MKKFLQFILLLIPFWVNAQVYHPTVDSSAVWNQIVTSYSVPYFTNEGYTFYFSDDSLIEGKVFKKLWRRHIYSFLSQGYQAISGSTVTEIPYCIGAMAEDSVRRVWFMPFSNLNVQCGTTFLPDSIYLLYDFGLNAGDTIGWSPYSSTIASIDSVQMLDGEWRRRWNLNNVWQNEHWVEGIGSSKGFFSPLDLQLECGAILSCFRLNGNLLFQSFPDSSFVINCDSISAGIPNDDLSQFSFQILPNPVSDVLTINFSSPNFSSNQIKITDVLGRNLITEEIKSNQPLQIETEKFSGNSMLFCELWQDGKLIGVKKVLIQK